MPGNTDPPNVDAYVGEFRLDNESLAFRFTATVSERRGSRLERLTTPESLGAWLALNGLPAGSPRVADLRKAVALREAVYEVGLAVAESRTPDPQSVALLNAASRDGKAHRVLQESRAEWATVAGREVASALGVLAADAIEVLGLPTRARIKVCEFPSCGGLFVDASRGVNRRWCSMNYCGNRAKKAAMHARPATPTEATV